VIVDTETILNSISSKYPDPNRKLRRMVENGEIVRLKRGLYETDPTTPPFAIANDIFGPSYISFESALSWYGVIQFSNPIGTFRYKDVPARVFEIGVIEWEAYDRKFRIASKEKAVCDKLYKMPPVYSLDDVNALMFEDLRFDDDEILGMDLDLI